MFLWMSVLLHTMLCVRMAMSGRKEALPLRLIAPSAKRVQETNVAEAAIALITTSSKTLRVIPSTQGCFEMHHILLVPSAPTPSCNGCGPRLDRQVRQRITEPSTNSNDWLSKTVDCNNRQVVEITNRVDRHLKKDRRPCHPLHAVPRLVL